MPPRTFLSKLWRQFTHVKYSGGGTIRRIPAMASSPERLEARIAPAALINPSTIEYKDSAGDIVTVKFSQPLFGLTGANAAKNLTNANTCLQFDTGANAVTAGPFDAATAPEQQLQLIDLADLPIAVAAGVSISVTTAKHTGTADVGYVNATGISLGTVSIDGDLGRINAGAAGAKFGVESLSARSIGAEGTATQAASGASLESTIAGVLGSLHVTHDVTGASIIAQDDYGFLGNLEGYGSIGSITIGGSLVGASGNQTGYLGSDTTIGAVKIGATLVGGDGTESGKIFAGSTIRSVTISGSVTGGSGDESGSIFGQFGIGPVTIGGNLVAGTGSGSGLIFTPVSMGPVIIRGNIDATVSGVGQGSGGLEAGGGIFGVTLTGSLKGGSSAQSGFIDAGTFIGPIVLGAIDGGSAQEAGTITAGAQITSVSVLGSLVGSSGPGSGSIFSGTDTQYLGFIDSLKVGGGLSGGSGASSGMIDAAGKIGAIAIGPAKPISSNLLDGGEGDFSGSIFALGGISSVKITGAVQGGAGSFSGSIVSHDNVASDLAGDLGAVVITGSVQGGAGNNAGEIYADGNLASFAAGGLVGSTGANGGSVLVGQGILHPGTVGSIKVNGVLNAGSGAESGSIIAESSIATLLVTGAASGGTIRAGDSIGALTFDAGVADFTISARGAVKPTATSDVAIGKLTVTGNVSQTEFLAGYDTGLDPSNPDAQIGPVLVKGNWTASDLVAGVTDGTAVGFGTTADAPIAGTQPPGLLSELVSVVISGTVTGTAASGDHYGFTAEKIGALSVDGKKVLITQPGQPVELDPVNLDITALEVSV